MYSCPITAFSRIIGAGPNCLFTDKGFDVVAVDKDMRGYFHAPEVSTSWSVASHERSLPSYDRCPAMVEGIVPSKI